MKYMKLLILVLLAFSSTQSFSTAYFIDEIECSHLDENEIPSIEKKLKKQKDCEQIFSHFNLQLFTWFNTQQLEAINLDMKESGLFSKGEIKIKPSKQKHVSLQGAFTPSKKRPFKLMLSNENQGEEKNTRQTLRANFSYTNTSSIVKKITYGMSQFNTSFTTDASSKTENKYALSNNNLSISNLYITINSLKNNRQKIKTRIDYYSTSSDDLENSKTDYQVTTDWTSQLHPYYSKFRHSITPSIIVSSYQHPNPNKKHQYISFIGVRSFINWYTKYLSMNLNYSLFSSIGMTSKHYFHHISFELVSKKIWNIKHSLIYETKTIHSKILPQHQHVFDMTLQKQYAYQAVASPYKNLDLLFKAGQKSQKDNDEDKNNSFNTSSYFEVAVQTEAFKTQFNIAFNIQANRTY